MFSLILLSFEAATKAVQTKAQATKKPAATKPAGGAAAYRLAAAMPGGYSSPQAK